METGATVAFQEDGGSWQNEAEHQQRLRMRRVKELRSKFEDVTRRRKRHLISIQMFMRYVLTIYKMCIISLINELWSKEIHSIYLQLVRSKCYRIKSK